jgi:cell filamentation protein
MSGRYRVTSTEGEFEPGSEGRVLRDLLGLRSVDDINEVELGLLGQLYGELLFQQFPDRALTVADLKALHRPWLGNVYAWAGQERAVKLGKGDSSSPRPG